MLTLLLLAQEIQMEAVEYTQGDVQLQGWIACDKKGKGKRPGVMIVHEWKGVGDYVKMRAEMIAKLGYVAFAADMYGKGVYAKDTNEASRLAGPFFKDRKKMRDRAKAGYDVLAKHERCDPTRIAAMGYCFGGTTALEMARAGMDLRIVGSFHGNLENPLRSEGKLKPIVAVFHGAADRYVGDVEAFKKEMAQSDLRFHAFEGAVHSFTVKEAGDDPSKGLAYDEKADKESWELWVKYLAEAFK